MADAEVHCCTLQLVLQVSIHYAYNMVHGLVSRSALCEARLAFQKAKI